MEMSPGHTFSISHFTKSVFFLQNGKKKKKKKKNWTGYKNKF